MRHLMTGSAMELPTALRLATSVRTSTVQSGVGFVQSWKTHDLLGFGRPEALVLLLGAPVGAKHVSVLIVRERRHVFESAHLVFGPYLQPTRHGKWPGKYLWNLSAFVRHLNEAVDWKMVKSIVQYQITMLSGCHPAKGSTPSH